MPKYTGVNGRLLINGQQRGGLKSFECHTLDVKSIPNMGQGDVARSSVPVFIGWEGRGELDFDLGVSPATYMALALSQATVPFIGELDNSEGSFIAGNIRVKDAGVRVQFDDVATHTVEFEGQGLPTIIDGAAVPP